MRQPFTPKAGVDDGLMMEVVAKIALMTVTNYPNRLPILIST
jgi:hypothetical protein